LKFKSYLKSSATPWLDSVHFDVIHRDIWIHKPLKSTYIATNKDVLTIFVEIFTQNAL